MVTWLSGCSTAARERWSLALDIETDDVEAEATRLEALGARRVKKIHTWWVMEAPTGHRFCVVRTKTDLKTAAGATEWP